MSLSSWNSIAVEQLNPLMSRQVVHTERLTIALLKINNGAVVPRHSHENEQVTQVLSGSLLFKLPDGDVTVDAGGVLVLRSHLPHEVHALEDSVALDVFTPRREDWIRGDDAYLRG
jgi:quercetin dioxygenase-like cupin family protein